MRRQGGVEAEQMRSEVAEQRGGGGFFAARRATLMGCGSRKRLEFPAFPRALRMLLENLEAE